MVLVLLLLLLLLLVLLDRGLELLDSAEGLSPASTGKRSCRWSRLVNPTLPIPPENPWAPSRSKGLGRGLGKGQALAPRQPRSLISVGGPWLCG